MSLFIVCSHWTNRIQGVGKLCGSSVYGEFDNLNGARELLTKVVENINNNFRLYNYVERQFYINELVNQEVVKTYPL